MLEISEKERLINSFFKITVNNQLDKLNSHKKEFEWYLVDKEDRDISDLIQVTNAVIMYFETGDRERCRRWVNKIWERLENKLDTDSEMSFFEIRLLNYILFTETDIKILVEKVEECLYQLLNYSVHEEYVKVSIILKLNLIDSLLEAKYFDERYKNQFDERISEIIEEVITLNSKKQMNNNLYVGLANMFKGIFLENWNIFYTGSLLLESSSEKDKKALKHMIKLYTCKYKANHYNFDKLSIYKLTH